MTSQWRSVKFAAAHDASEFDCGVPELNGWLQREGMRAQNQGTGLTRVWLPHDSDRVYAFYTIAPNSVSSAGLTRAQSGGHSVVPRTCLGNSRWMSVCEGKDWGQICCSTQWSTSSTRQIKAVAV